MKKLILLTALAIATIAQMHAERTEKTVNTGWEFKLEADKEYTMVNIPHTYNLDAYTTRNYYRGKAEYRKMLTIKDLDSSRSYFLRFDAVSKQAEVWVNGKQLANHSGGYSSFVVDITDVSKERNEIVVRVDNATQDSAVIALARRIFGNEELSVLTKVHLLNKLQQRIEDGQYSNSSSEITEKEKADNEKRIYSDYLLTKSELTDSFFQVKADRIYQHYLDTSDFTYKLPQTKATQVLQKITNQFKGRYVFLDFWSTGCGPCRANIEATEAIREELRKNPELAFVFITSDEESPEMVYNKYVEKHLKNDYTCRLPKDEYVLLRELFQFNGIPHYETLDKQGDVIRINAHWDDMESFNYILGNINKEAGVV